MLDTLEDLHEYVTQRGAVHISGRELLAMRRLGVQAPLPPRTLWPRIIPTIAVFELIRERVGHPLIIGNGYRPHALNKRAGGSRFSAHVPFRALDLDLPRDRRAGIDQVRFYEAAASVWDEYGERYQMGLGLYSRFGGTRVHIDTYHKPWPLFRSRRTWKRGYARQILETI